jgi:N-acetylmuramoyl-L-alanine amidase
MVDRKEIGKTLNLEIDFIPESNSNRPGTKMKPEYITIHNTDNTGRGAGALAHAKYMKGQDAQNRKVSWHYTVDDNLCVKHLPINEMGWHAASAEGNKKSIGIEICMNEGIDQNSANKRAATLTAILMYDLNIPIVNVLTHHHWSGKNCPRLLLDNKKPGEKWKKFLEEVNRIYRSIEPQDEMIANLFSDRNELFSEWSDAHGAEK